MWEALLVYFVVGGPVKLGTVASPNLPLETWSTTVRRPLLLHS